MSGIQWQDDEQSFPALKHPLWDYNDNVLGFPSSRRACIHPLCHGITRPHNAELAYLATSYFQLQSTMAPKTVTFSFSSVISWFSGGERECHTAGPCLDSPDKPPDAWFLLSRKMAAWDFRRSHTFTPSQGGKKNIPAEIFHNVFTQWCHIGFLPPAANA